MTGRNRIVVGVDGSEHSKLALRWAARLARAEDAHVEAVAAWEFPVYAGYGGMPYGYVPEQEMEKVLAETVDEVFGADRPEGLQLTVVQGNPARVLLEVSEDAMMLVVGSRGHGGFMGLLLGSVSGKVAEHANCPVLVVHEPKLDRAEPPS